MTFYEQLNRVRALATSARWIVAAGSRASSSSEICFLDLQGGTRNVSVPSAVNALLALGGDRFLAALDDGTIRVVSPSILESSVDAHSAPVTALALAVDGVTVASACADGSVKLWKISSVGSTELIHSRTFALSGQPARACAFDATAEHLGVGGDDGIVRSITLATGAVREMPGHEGPVHAITFNPLDGRLVSGGDDGTIRVWFLSGDIESETKGGENGHTAAVRAIAMGPVVEGAPGDEPSVRLFSAGDDGVIKVWRMGDRRRPRTIEPGVGPLRALALLSPQTQGGAGAVVAGERRRIARLGIDNDGALTDRTAVFEDGFAHLDNRLSAGKPAERQEVLRTLAPMLEDEARVLIERAVTTDAEAEVRLAAIRHLVEHRQRASRPVMRSALDDRAESVREAAFDALVSLDEKGSLAPINAALKSRAAESRARALRFLVAMSPRSPLAHGLIESKLTDVDATVRLAALESLVALFPANDVTPLKEAFERSTVDVKIEVLSRASFAGWIEHPTIAPMVVRAMDDTDADVRRTAFVVAVRARRSLVEVLSRDDGQLARWSREVVRRVATARWKLVEAMRSHAGEQRSERPVPDDALDAAVAEIPAVGTPNQAPTEQDLAPLLAAMACRAPDSAVRGARGLAQAGDLRALGALLQLSREQDPEIRRQAALALEPLHDSRARKRLVWLLEDPVANVREAAFIALRNLEGGDTVALAETALRSGQEDIRMRALSSMIAGGGEQPSSAARALLGDALEDESSKVRAEAFRTLWAWHTADPQPAIARALRCRFADVRSRAVAEAEALSKQGWAVDSIAGAIADRDASVAQAAYDALVRVNGKSDSRAYLLAMESTHVAVRASSVRGARDASGVEVRAALLKLVEDSDGGVRNEAIDSLAKLFPSDNAPLVFGLRSSFLDVRVRAAEHLAARRDEVMFEPMQALLVDKELVLRVGSIAHSWRQRASVAIATLGSHRVVSFCAKTLLHDDDGQVREQASRALSTATKRGDESLLVEALGHNDLAVRSWAAEGLARLGDARALPVLTGTLRHTHPPIRIGAILSFAALGPEGYGGLLQGLEDESREVQQ
ncbi:MAG: HEAT repeat domain-containing protein, partial [Polyangiaceae bacterium]